MRRDVETRAHPEDLLGPFTWCARPIDDEDSLALTSQCGAAYRDVVHKQNPSLGQPVRGARVAGPRRTTPSFPLCSSSITASPAPAAYLAIVNESNVAYVS